MSKKNKQIIINELNKLNQVIFESNEKVPNGRSKMKLIIHEIFKTSDEFQENGVSWNEEYVLKNLDSIKNMPLAIEQVDYDELGIGGHGDIEYIETENGTRPLFNTIPIGTFTNAYITDVEINGITKRVLIGEVILYEDRNHELIEGFKEYLKDNDLYTSVEITGTKENDNELKYLNDITGEGRIPTEYDYTGCVVLSSLVRAGDSSAHIIEINNKLNNKEDNTMAGEDKGITYVDLNQFEERIKSVITEKNETESELRKKYDELVKSAEQKDIEIDKLKKEVTDLKLDADERQKIIDDLNKRKESESNELNELRREKRMEKFMSEYNAISEKYPNECNAIKDEFVTKIDDEDLDVDTYIKELHAKAYTASLKSEVNNTEVNSYTGSASMLSNTSTRTNVNKEIDISNLTSIFSN